MTHILKYVYPLIAQRYKLAQLQTHLAVLDG